MKLASREQPRTAPEAGHVPALDGVRGIAILAVVAGHLLISNNISSSPAIQAILDIRDQFWIGVTLFFSLSGFLITGILFDTRGTDNYFRAFYGRRVLRIFPIYYGVLLVFLILTPVLHLNWHGQMYKLWTYTTNIPFTHNWDSDPAPYLNFHHFWSLAVEEQFYLIWPFVLYRLRDWNKIFAVALSGSVLALVFRTLLVIFHVPPQNHSLPFCMDALLLGGALALLVRSPYRPVVLRMSVWIFLAAAAVTLWQAFRNPNLSWADSPFLSTLGMTIVAIGTTALVAASLAPGSFTERFCRLRILRFFGKYSYGIYVYHYSLDSAFTQPLRRWLRLHGCGQMSTVLLGALPILAMSTGIAVLSYQLYEKHFLRLKRYFPYHKPIRTEELGSETLAAAPTIR